MGLDLTFYEIKSEDKDKKSENERKYVNDLMNYYMVTVPGIVMKEDSFII